MFLEKKQISTDEIQRIMSAKEPFNAAKSIYNLPTRSKTSMQRIYLETGECIENLAIIWCLRDTKPEITFELCFMYFVYRIALLFSWNMKDRKYDDIEFIKNFLSLCENNEHRKIISYFNIDILSCFAVSHLKSNIDLQSIFDFGFNHLAINCKNNNSAHGNFYLNFGKNNVEGIIYKIIESAYIISKFSTNKLFIDSKNFVTVEPEKLKYDISTMRQDRTAYFPNDEHKRLIIDDVLSLNTFLEEANKLAQKFPNVKIEQKNINFFSSTSNLDVRDYCCFFYTPNTPTGKAAKYPIRLLFQTTQNIFGEIEYLQGITIGKIKIVVWYKKQCFVVHCIDEKGNLGITKIEYTNTACENEVLYNANAK